MKQKQCSLLIAEDEQIERESLVKIIKDSLGTLTEVHSAKNGLEACEMFDTYMPEIVLMDIEMPGISGLEAIVKIKEKYKDRRTVFVILTSYDYFRYAKEAIHLGVEDFLLKPVMAEEIINVVSKSITKIYEKRNEQTQASALVQKLNELQPILELQCFHAILSKFNEVALREEFQRLNVFVVSGFCLVFSKSENGSQIHTIKNEIQDFGYTCLKGEINQKIILYVLYSDYLTKHDFEIITEVLNKKLKFPTTIGVGSLQDNIAKLHHSYTQALGNQRIYKDIKEFFVLLDELPYVQENNALEERVDAIVTSFLKQDNEEITKLIHQYANELYQFNVQEINDSILSMRTLLVKKLGKSLNIDIEQEMIPEIKAKEGENLQNLDIRLLHGINDILNPLQAVRYQESNILIRKAMAYIQENFRKPISLRELSRSLDVSPYYISRLFSNYSHKNFTDIVCEFRIEEAKLLLRKNGRIKEIYFMVGFQSQSYFSKMFRKVVGVTPKEYQNLFH